MNIKHFLKTLVIFAGMIVLGLLGVYLVNHFDKSDVIEQVPSAVEVAK